MPQLERNLSATMRSPCSSAEDPPSHNKDPVYWGFPGGAVVENLPANAGDNGSNPGLGGSHMLWSN